MFAFKARPKALLSKALTNSARPSSATASTSTRRFLSHTSSSSSSTGSSKPVVMRREFQYALVGGLLLATSYVSINNRVVKNDSNGGSGAAGALGREAGERQFSTSSATTDSVTNGGTGHRDGKGQIPIFTDEEVDRRLRQFEESYIVNRGKGVARYDVCQLPSNNPIEDDRSEKIVEVPLKDREERVDTDWYFWSVFDGHAGWATSSYLRQDLLETIIDQLASSAYKITPEDASLRMIPTSDSIDRAIKSGFIGLDNEIVNTNVQKLLSHPENKSAAAELLMPALSGSCALMSFYDSQSKRLKVAVTGDSRALLGSQNDNGQWTVQALSVDQTGKNPSEVARLLSEHPNEPNVVRNGRVLGSLEPTRAFGDARYKWSRDTQLKVYNEFFGRQLPQNLKTPPYVTAEPVVTTHDIDPSKHDFLVMASDGLYEMLSNEEIVGLVVKWMEKKEMIQPPRSFLDGFFPTKKDRALPEVLDVSDSSSKSQKQPFRRGAAPKTGKYLLEDSNVATHLVRNALSNGGSKEHVNLLVSIPSPLSRRYRDDLTVTVVFFDEKPVTEGSGLVVNKEATKGGLENAEKSKL